MKFTGQSEDGNRMEIMELDNHPFYCAVQYHPEYISRPNKPSAVYLGLILSSIGKLNSFIENRSTSFQYKLDTLAVSAANMLDLNDQSYWKDFLLIFSSRILFWFYRYREKLSFF